MKTRSQGVAADVAALLRARNSLIWIVTREEARVERHLLEAAAAANYVPRTWDCAQGVASMPDGKPQQMGGPDCSETLGTIRARAADATGGADRGLWIMRDLPVWLSGPIGIVANRQLRNLARYLPTRPKDSAQAVVIVTPSSDIPPELIGHATMIEWPLPDRVEIGALLDAAIRSLPDEIREAAAPNGQRDAAIDAAVGLTGEEAASCFARSLVQLRKIDPKLIAGEKRRIITREKVLEWYDPLPGGLDAVGGLDNLKAWLRSRAAAYTPAARAYGLPAPKGALLVGVPGCGKSLTAKAVGTAWNVPVLKLDLGSLKSKYVGESEGKLRNVFRVVEAIGRCVLWVDEIEKGLQGATSGSADGGVSADALGALLSWMQERKGEAFIIATANDATQLPPELMRKGRFDEVWSIDLPNEEEREQILRAALRSNGRDPSKINLVGLAARTEGFTGSEIADFVPEALFTAFADGGREPTAVDMLAACKTVIPLAKTAAEKIKTLREWAASRARPATAPMKTVEASAKTERVLNF